MTDSKESPSPMLPQSYQGVYLDGFTTLTTTTTSLFNSNLPNNTDNEHIVSSDEVLLWRSSGSGSSPVQPGGVDTDLTDIETAILRANQPIHIDETDEIEVAGSRGIWANKSEVNNWRGPKPIDAYPINEDPDPHIVTKSTSQMIEYVQEMAVR